MILSIMYYFTNFGDLCDSGVSIYMGFLEVPPIMIRNFSPNSVIYFLNKISLILIMTAVVTITRCYFKIK